MPYLLGANADEGYAVLHRRNGDHHAGGIHRSAAGPFRAALAAQVEAVYPVTSFASPQAALVRVVGDAGLVCATHDVARRVAAAGRRTYVYEFARVPPFPFVSFLNLGAFHGSEIAYVFGSVTTPNSGDTSAQHADAGVLDAVRREGRGPRATKSAPWPRFRPKTYEMLRFDALGDKEGCQEDQEFSSRRMRLLVEPL